MRRKSMWVLLLALCVVSATFSAYANGTAMAEPEKSQALKFLENTEIHGTVDTMYNYNINRPTSAVDNNGNGIADTGTNALHTFDTDANSFSLNLVELAIQNQPADWAMFRFDLDFGRDTRVFQAAGFNDGDNFELQQGYVKLTAKVGNGLNFTLGKFVTLHGSEVIESANNMNASRSLLFGWAIPFTHTGIMADYTFNDQWMLTLGVVNGWDNVADNNHMKTIHGMITYKPVPDKVTIILGGTVGPEQDNSDGNIRGLIDGVITWAATEKLTLVLNADLGKEEGIGGSGFANWWGAAAYAHWRATDLFGLTLRGEYFDEDNPAGVGVRTGTAADKMGEGTLTSHLYLFDGFDLRFEFRHDHAANSIFTKADGGTRKFQDVVLAEAVYSF